jgi:hypothetical protein
MKGIQDRAFLVGEAIDLATVELGQAAEVVHRS